MPRKSPQMDVDSVLESIAEKPHSRSSGISRSKNRGGSTRKSTESNLRNDWSPSSGSSSSGSEKNLKKLKRKHRSRSLSRSRSKSGSRGHSSHRRRSRSRSHEKRRSTGRGYGSRSRSRDRGSSRYSRSRRSPSPPRYSKPWIPPKERAENREDNLTLEQRDARTIFCMQLAARTDERALEDFFKQIGKVRDIRLIMDNRTKRHKGIAYVEFKDVKSVATALTLNGQRLNGVPIQIQVTQSEKNVIYNAYPGATPAEPASGPMKLYIGNLHFNVDEEMIRSIFEHFGRIEKIEMLKDNTSGRSRGYCFLTFCNSEHAKKAMEQMNGYELAGREIKVNYVTDHGTGPSMRNLDADEIDTAGMPLGATGRLHLMAKLAEGTGMKLPEHTQKLLQQQQVQSTPVISTQCFVLSNMFDLKTETDDNWPEEVREDVAAECARHGGLVHIFVDKDSADGNVYCKAPTIAIAVACVNSLHGRSFAGKIITANYVPVTNYHELFPHTR